MDFWFALQAVGLGLAVAAPVGPMGLLCINRTLARGRAAGLSFGLGVAAADATYAAIAAFGILGITAALSAATFWIRLGGGLLLLWMGAQIALSRPGAAANRQLADSNLRAFAAAYGLTLTNPPTILFFAGLFASLGTAPSGSSSTVFTAGIFAGSTLWWIFLTAAVAAGAKWLTPGAMVWINRVSGFVLIVLALRSLLQAASL